MVRAGRVTQSQPMRLFLGNAGTGQRGSCDPIPANEVLARDRERTLARLNP